MYVARAPTAAEVLVRIMFKHFLTVLSFQHSIIYSIIYMSSTTQQVWLIQETAKHGSPTAYARWRSLATGHP